MSRLADLVTLIVIFLVLFAAPVAGAEHPRFSPTVPLDSSQIIDTRNVWGELVCPADESVPCRAPSKTTPYG